MCKKLMMIGFLVVLISLFISTVPAIGVTIESEKVYELTANIIGPGPIGTKKAENIELAAEELNKMLESMGSPVRVKVSVKFSTLKWGPFADKFYMDFRAGKAPDIVNLRWDPKLADGKFIIPLDKYIAMWWDLDFYDFYSNLWKGVTWKNNIWGIPNDICPAGVWYRKDVLRKLGYNDEEILKMLPSDGKTTLNKLAELAKKAVDAGLVEYGILHRPSKGAGFYATLLEFGVKCYDTLTGNLVIDEPALLKFYKWHADMVKEGVIPPEPPSWKTIHATFVEGKTFCTLASHVGTPGEWKKKYGLTDKALENDLGFLPFPPAVRGIEPTSVHEFAPYMITTKCKHPDIAALLIMFATSPHACAIHSAYTLRPPYRGSALEDPLIKDNEYIQKTAPSVKTVQPVPVHPNFWDYMTRAFNALKGVEAGIITPTQAVDDLKSFGTTIPHMEFIKK
ncbi:MAG: extracellular solute-binding protein [Thermotogae bacterium]|nr:extracellular solute-binding protein [Thermotogota bacterium]